VANNIRQMYKMLHVRLRFIRITFIDTDNREVTSQIHKFFLNICHKENVVA